MPSDPRVLADAAHANPTDLVEIATHYGPPTVFAIHLIAEAVTLTSAHGMTASVVALGVGMYRSIGDYPPPARTALGEAVRLHWQALHYR